MGKIDEFRSEGTRIISNMGNSLGISIPKNILARVEVGKGQIVEIHSDGKYLVLINLKADVKP